MTTITAGPTPPNRNDPENFDDAGDAFAAWMVVMASQANALAAEVNAMHDSAAVDAATATTKAGEASAARDIAMAAVNYKGIWSSLSGALNIPASAFYSGSIWMLTENVANVATEVPGVSAKWLNVTPATGLGSAAYQPSSAFQPAIGALTGLLQSAGSGSISAATAAQIVAAIGSVYVANASHATSANFADSATTIMDGAVSSAAKVANGILTWAKFAAMNTSKLIGRSTAGGGSPEEITVGARLTLIAGVLSADAAPAVSYQTTPSVLSSGSIQTFAHGLASVPKHISVKLLVTTATDNWSVGDVLEGIGETIGGVVNRVVFVGCDATNITVVCNGANLGIPNKTTGAYATPAVGNFKVIVGVAL